VLKKVELVSSDNRSNSNTRPGTPALLEGGYAGRGKEDRLLSSEVETEGSTLVMSTSKRMEIKSLEEPVTQGGQNLSVGTRQLLAMARSMLRRSKLIIMDEVGVFCHRRMNMFDH
jgi:ABC-type molybdenum transport system ATPase subunit/photorepair protein PhrA